MKRKGSAPWSQAELEYGKALHANGFGPQLIADLLRRPRASVVGKFWREMHVDAELYRHKPYDPSRDPRPEWLRHSKKERANAV